MSSSKKAPVTCDYCGKPTTKPRKVGPKLNYCDYNCYALYCAATYPGTPLDTAVRKMYPELFAEVTIE